MSFKKFLPEPPSVLQHARSARYPLPAKSSCRQELLSACCLYFYWNDINIFLKQKILLKRRFFSSIIIRRIWRIRNQLL